MWLSDETVAHCYEQNRVYVGAGTLQKFTDLATINGHEIREVFHLALRPCQGFINSLFRLKKLPSKCPSYSCLSKRLAKLHLKSLDYKKANRAGHIKAIAIDSTGIKQFPRSEWLSQKSIK